MCRLSLILVCSAILLTTGCGAPVHTDDGAEPADGPKPNEAEPANEAQLCDYETAPLNGPVPRFSRGFNTDKGGRGACISSGESLPTCRMVPSQFFAEDHNATLGLGRPPLICEPSADEKVLDCGEWSVQVPEDVVEWDYSDHHLCARLENGDVRCWGENVYQAIDPEQDRKAVFAPCGRIVATNASDLAVSHRLTATLSDGTLTLSGIHVAPGNRTLQAPTGSERVFAASEHLTTSKLAPSPGPVWVRGYPPQEQVRQLCVLDENERLTCHGSQYGRNLKVLRLMRDRGFDFPWEWRVQADLSHLTGIADIALTAHWGCALDANGELWCWRFWDPEPTPPDVDPPGELVVTPLALSNIDGMDFQGVDVDGWAHRLCTISENQRILCWGLRLDDHLAGYLPSPHTVHTEVRKAQFTESHGCWIRTDGSIWCRGDNRCGQLGPVDVEEPGFVGFHQPTQIGDSRSGGDEEFEDLSISGTHGCGLTTASEVFCWGANSEGQLGQGKVGEPSAMARVEVVSGPVDQVTVGRDATCVLKEGEVSCWGRLPWLGDEPQLEPVVIERLQGATHIGTRSLPHSGLQEVCGAVGNGVKCHRKTISEKELEGPVWAWSSSPPIGIDAAGNSNHHLSDPNPLEVAMAEEASRCVLYEDGWDCTGGLIGEHGLSSFFFQEYRFRSFAGEGCGVTEDDELICWGPDVLYSRACDPKSETVHLRLREYTWEFADKPMAYQNFRLGWERLVDWLTNADCWFSKEDRLRGLRCP